MLNDNSVHATIATTDLAKSRHFYDSTGVDPAQVRLVEHPLQ